MDCVEIEEKGLKMEDDERLFLEEKGYHIGWLDGYNKCLEEYHILEKAKLQTPIYVMPIDAAEMLQRILNK